jgi:hypothetical protein
MGGRRWRRTKSIISLPLLHFPSVVDGYAIVTISGEIDIARDPALREQLIGLLRPGSASRCNVQAAALL